MRPPARAMMSRTRMKTYFIGASSVRRARVARGLLGAPGASRLHLLGAGGGEDLAHGCAPFRRAVHRHAEAGVGEAWIERWRRPQARGTGEDDHSEERCHAAEDD